MPFTGARRTRQQSRTLFHTRCNGWFGVSAGNMALAILKAV
jgi:hypothetical protein